MPTTTFKLTARFVNSPPGSPYLPATFRSKHSYVGLPMLKAYSSVFIDFRFKTLEPNGLLFYNGGKRSDFLAVELVNGHIHYVFDVGDGPITVRDKARIHMNDNRWHSVSIRRPGPKTHTLAVDESIEIYTASGNNMHLELEGILYVGGVFKDMYTRLPSSIASRSGFEGCMASVDLADSSPSLTEDAVVPSSLVVSGCEGPTKCSQNACANRGICVQQWNAYACECDMTSFTGPTCYDGKTGLGDCLREEDSEDRCSFAESISYEFGNNKGLIQYTFPPGRQPDTEEDNIALGFVTTKSDAVLLRVESSTTQDYIEMEIVRSRDLGSDLQTLTTCSPSRSKAMCSSCTTSARTISRSARSASKSVTITTTSCASPDPERTQRFRSTTTTSKRCSRPVGVARARQA